MYIPLVSHHKIRDISYNRLAEVDLADQPDLYRCASLLDAGAPLAASSDAPYATADPWLAITAATQRRTRGGLIVGPAEQITPARALALYLGPGASPGARPRRVAVGAAADLCLLGAPLSEALSAPNAALVRATLIGGRLAHDAIS